MFALVFWSLSTKGRTGRANLRHGLTCEDGGLTLSSYLQILLKFSTHRNLPFSRVFPINSSTHLLCQASDKCEPCQDLFVASASTLLRWSPGLRYRGCSSTIISADLLTPSFTHNEVLEILLCSPECYNSGDVLKSHLNATHSAEGGDAPA